MAAGGGPVYASRIWLTRGGGARLAVRGALELQGTRLRVVLDDRRPPAPMVAWLGQRSGEPESGRRLARGEGWVLVDRPVPELGLTFVGAEQNLEVTDGRGCCWHLCFTEPGAPEVLARWRRKQERKAARWRELLAGALAAPDGADPAGDGPAPGGADPAGDGQLPGGTDPAGG